MNTPNEVRANIEEIVESYKKLRSEHHATALKIGINTASSVQMISDTLRSTGYDSETIDFLTETASHIGASTMEMVVSMIPLINGETKESLEKELAHYINLTVSQMQKIDLSAGDDNDTPTKH